MKRWQILLCSTLLLLTACTAPTEPAISDNESPSWSEEPDASMSESESSNASFESESGSVSESSPSSISSAASPEESSIPNPDIGADASPEEIELERNAWNLQEHLKEVLPPEAISMSAKTMSTAMGETS